MEETPAQADGSGEDKATPAEEQAETQISGDAPEGQDEENDAPTGDAPDGEDKEEAFGSTNALSRAEQHVLAHLARTEEFVKKWREMMVMMTAIVVVIVLYQTLQVYKNDEMTRGILIFQILSVFQSLNTAYYVLVVLAKVPRKPTLTRTVVAFVPQGLMYLSSRCNQMLAEKKVPLWLSNVVLKDFVLPESAWPISLLEFFIIYGALWVSDLQMNSAETAANPILKRHGLADEQTTDGAEGASDKKNK